MLHLGLILICWAFYSANDDCALMFDICWWSCLVYIGLWSIEIATFITCKVALSRAASQIRFLSASQWVIRLVLEVLLVHWSLIESRFLVCLIFFVCHTLSSLLRLPTACPVVLLLTLQGQWESSLETWIDHEIVACSWHSMDIATICTFLLAMSRCKLGNLLENIHFLDVVSHISYPIVILLSTHPCSDFHILGRIQAARIQTICWSFTFLRWEYNFLSRGSRQLV